MRNINFDLSKTITYALVSAVILLANTVVGSTQTVGNLTITNTWIRATPPVAKVAGGFMVITNNGTADDILLAVDFSGAKKSEIHQMKMDNGVMTMRPLKDGLTLGAGKKTILKPGGFHLMFMGLQNQLKDGQKVPVKLTFANAGEISIDFDVFSMAKGKKLMMQEN